jgi:hypothetical protein
VEIFTGHFTKLHDCLCPLISEQQNLGTDFLANPMATLIGKKGAFVTTLRRIYTPTLAE